MLQWAGQKSRSSPAFFAWYSGRRQFSFCQFAGTFNPCKKLTMPTTIPPAKSQFVTLAQFLAMKQAYSDNKNSILQPAYQGDVFLCVSELFNIDAIKAVAAVPGCAALRIYYGMKTDLTVHAMLCAADINGVDILPSAADAKFAPDSGNPPIVEEGQRCPPDCS
jgi:hypothetical protein